MSEREELVKEMRQMKAELKALTKLVREHMPQLKATADQWVGLETFMEMSGITYPTLKYRWEQHPEITTGKMSTRKIHLGRYESLFGKVMVTI